MKRVSDDNDDSNRKKRANGHSVFILWKIVALSRALQMPGAIFFDEQFFAREPRNGLLFLWFCNKGCLTSFRLQRSTQRATVDENTRGVRARGERRAMADLREGLLAPRGASEDDRDDVFEDEADLNDGRLDATAPAAEWTHVATATLSLTMTAVGSVVLSLPATFAECGWLAGIAVLLVVALLMDVSLLFIVGAARSARANSYEDAARALLGPTGGACVEIALVCLVYGSLVSLQIIIADQVQPVASAALANAPHLPHFIAERWFITCVSTALVYPMTLAKSLSALASATTAAFFVLLFVAGAVVAEFGKKGWIPDPSVVAVETSKGATPCALALPVVAMAYACHFNIVAIDRELPKTRRGKACVGKVIHASILAGMFIILLYLEFLHLYGQLD